jgi:hypothetical protein
MLERFDMTQEAKTLAIDMSEVVERQQQAMRATGEMPKTIPVDSEKLASRNDENRASAAHQPAEAGRSGSWVAILAVAAVALLAYLVMG